MTLSAERTPDRIWSNFDISDRDLEFIYNLLLEREAPLTTREMASALVTFRLELLERETALVDASPAMRYLPAERYGVGQRLAFPALQDVEGQVVGIRAGSNPSLGAFEVVEVEFPGGHHREFAIGLAEHALNRIEEAETSADNLQTPESILDRHGKVIDERLTARLNQAKDIVRIAGRWFPRALLADIHAGHLNLAEAVLDVAGGGPLPTKDLVPDLGLAGDLDPLLAEFSLDYALQEDERFDEVGPAGRVLWYLRRLEPPEVLYPPPRLEPVVIPHDRSLLTESLLALERELDDELSPLPDPDEPPESVTLALLFPHWRVGTLPLSARLRTLFPTAYEAPRIRFILVDGQTGKRFPGWVVREQRYVFGLDEWYRAHDIPAGGLVRVRRGAEPGEVVVEASDHRKRNDWIRTISVDGAQVGFSMLKQPVGSAYDDLMIVGLTDAHALDEAWLRGAQRRMPVEKLVTHVFRELAKLNPQSAVHAQALYSGVNVLQRLAPAPIFCELLSRRHFSHVGDLYWRFDETAWSAA